VQKKKPVRGPFASAGNSPLAERELRRVAAVVGLLLATAVVAAAWPFGPVRWPRPGGVTKANYDRVAPGMPRGRVEEILGPDGRPDYYSPTAADEARRVYWTGPAGTTVAVSFDRDGRVLGKTTVAEAADWNGR
jgi:hypothetical protein